MTLVHGRRPAAPTSAVSRRLIAMVAACVLGAPCTTWAAISFQLTIAPSSISFSDANPTTTPTIAANSTVAVALRVSGAGSTQAWSVQALAAGDLVSGGNSIGISNVSWTVSGPSGGTCLRPCSCYAGTVSKVTSQVIFNGTANTNNSPACTQTYTLVNSWPYAVGSYSQTVTITATSP